MSSSPNAKAVEKEHKSNKEDSFSPFLGSVGWKEEWATNRSEIARVDELSKLTNGVVWFGKKNYQATHISNKSLFMEIWKALAPPDCPYMQTDIKNFYKMLQDNVNVKDTYTKSFVLLLHFT